MQTLNAFSTSRLTLLSSAQVALLAQLQWDLSLAVYLTNLTDHHNLRTAQR